MGHASTRSVTLTGLSAHLIDIDADTHAEAGAAPGDAGLHVVGLPELSVWPARARIRAAICNGAPPWPDTQVTVTVTPALPVYNAAADLALAVAALAAAGLIPPERIAGRVFLGELALDGQICPIRGVLPMVAAAVRAGISTVVVPAACAREAAQVPGAVVIPATRLADVVDDLCHGTLRNPHHDHGSEVALSSPFAVDLADVPGNPAARRALEVCAAGGHHLFLSGDGPATMLAERLPGILPPLTGETAREVAEIYSLAGHPGRAPGVTPPLSAPHHTSTAAAVFGSVAGNRPGAVSLAHCGVLHLADAPEFASPVLDGLCRPLDSGQVHLTGLGRSVRYPARFTLVLDTRPCPCPERREECACTPEVKRRYRARLALLLSRVAVRAPVEQRDTSARAGEPSATVAARVLAARIRAAHRLADTPWRTNAEIPAPDLRTRFPVTPEAAELLRSAANAGLVTADGLSRLLRVAWTLTDLRGADRPQADDAAGALDLWKRADTDAAR
ncbi:ATP-binding protein [Microbispora amethystogenes]|uniref:YifB family Mg chelatase-like AAA ATPase n=1 Tax=Microbispora amethystogenes TaxID=1427754 RepID=UPI0033F0832A